MASELICRICGKRATPPPADMSYEAERAAFVDAARKGNSSGLEMGLRWHNLTHHHPPLWKGHYPSAKALLKGELEDRGLTPPKKNTLEQMARVAVEFGTRVALSWSLLYRALLYWDLIGYAGYSHVDPGGELIKVPLPTGGVYDRPLQQCTEDDVREAIRAVKASKPNSSDLSAQEAALEKLLQVGLSKLVGTDGKGRLHLKHGHGKLRVDLRLDMDVDKLDGLIALLKRLL